ncbi:hypothetical protein Dret_2189 [Desulfohalobium retbaense DSM 5692]|uniref:Uncharacterized protein n=1 Tax=Desulfohalobium retbaense (strain ATCC 49708 / DSM 5692 / JCM 16813 / HR100) TaxID=485915 RepID=C8X4X6_DESRD|nr:hypothetical protein Dret_2189 [Desulfohalobium retbaense DSM 5692]
MKAPSLASEGAFMANTVTVEYAVRSQPYSLKKPFLSARLIQAKR